MTANSKAKTTILCCALLLGNALPTVARAQSGLIMQVKAPDGVNVVAKHMGTGAQFALFNVKDPSKCIGIYDPAANNTGGEPLTPAGLSNAAELQAISDASPVMNGKHWLQMSLYKGPAVPVGECNVGQSSANFAVSAQQTATPATSTPNAALQAPGVPTSPIGSNIYSTLPPPTFEIMSADAKKAVLTVNWLNKSWKLKIESTKGAGGALRGFGDALGNSAVGRSQAGNITTGGAAAVRLQLTDNFGDHVAMYYKPDGTPMAEDARSAGETTGRMISHWDKAVLADMGDKLRDYVKQKGQTAQYADTLDAMGGKVIAAAQ